MRTEFHRHIIVSMRQIAVALVGSRCRSAALRCARLGLAEDIRLGGGIERFDYTKGILDRLRAIDAFLAGHPQWKKRFAFVQIAAPTRSKLTVCSALQAEGTELNARHGACRIAEAITLRALLFL